MPRFTAFKGLRPRPELAARVAAPPYDVLTSEEARLRAGANVYSFLHVSKPEIDLPVGTDIYGEAVYVKARENLDRLVSQNVLQSDSSDCFYVYRMTMGTHSQTGVMGLASVQDYDNNRVKRHELTRPEKEDDRVRHMLALNAQTGPVLLAYRSHPEVDSLLVAASAQAPDVDVLADTGVKHTLWVIRDPRQCTRIAEGFQTLPAFYIADGHHRAAAASRVAELRRDSAPEGAEQSFLAVAFPHTQMRILDYNRVVSDLNGMSVDLMRQRLRSNFEIAPSATPVAPSQRGEFGMYVEGHWFRLRFRGSLMQGDAVSALDVSVLSNHLLAPILGIEDLRLDKRIDFVGGIRGLNALETRVDSGDAAVAFSLFPTSMEELMAVADDAYIMPPKSTWFEPKLADGLVSHRFE